MSDDVHITGFGAAPLKAEGEAMSYETVRRTPEEVIEYLKEQLRQARITQGRYSRIRRMARNQQLMVATKNGFTLVEDLDEYLTQLYNTPLTRQDILREGMEQLEEAFDRAEAENGINPRS